MNNQLGVGPGAWDAYLTAIEQLDPPVRGIGITDYYSVETYLECLRHQAQGRLPGCVVFPNVELRLNVGTIKGRFINAHLLVSPEHPNHVDQLRDFLGLLTFDGFGKTFSCTPDSLRQLGRKFRNDPALDDVAALRAGTEQFKVSLSELGELYRKDDWARANIFIGISGTSTDGTSGLDGADAVLRQEIERFSHIIFASSPAQRLYWLGQGAQGVAQLIERYAGKKACMHGSDAHALGRVGNPEQGRYTWIKGTPTFDGFRQAVLVPERAFVGSEPPRGILGNQVLTGISIQDAPWIQTPRIPLNAGLITIIGPRGSGKTALADMLAAGCDATPDAELEWEGGRRQTFIERAGDLLGDAEVCVEWKDGDKVSRALLGPPGGGGVPIPRVRYLSQQFVERLCSAEGITDELLAELQRVVFEAQASEEKAGLASFSDLYDEKTRRTRSGREMDENRLAELSQQIAEDLERRTSLPGLLALVGEKGRVMHDIEQQRGRLVSAGSAANLARLQGLEAALGSVQMKIRQMEGRRRDIEILSDEVQRFRASGSPAALRQLQQAHAVAGLSVDDWKNFELVYAGKVDDVLSKRGSEVSQLLANWVGAPLVPPAPGSSLLNPDHPAAMHARSVLEAEIAGVRMLVTADQATASQYAELTKRLELEVAAKEKLERQVSEAQAAEERLKSMVTERETTYRKIFTWIAKEQAMLEGLYEPLRQRVASAGGTLGKLTFKVERHVDVRQWAEQAQGLLDFRRSGEFRGVNSIESYARDHLLKPWKSGTPDEATAAMAHFREAHHAELLDKALVPRERRDEYRNWMKRFSRWVYSTDHVQLRYGIEYDGIDITRLSPGTRGIVLLQLYLGLDEHDGRPLIIDQPEENLDPRSIFSELVPLFCEAKERRQVILVTHNANLVVNTDADQVIVATAGTHETGGLPSMLYRAGSIDDPTIRSLVCEILEGGKAAFQERARRLRVDFSAA
ncbi:AAA family ATPase [Bacillus sp. NP157]|nr:AAA family ATPase [Bacillus sp. NP157]